MSTSKERASKKVTPEADAPDREDLRIGVISDTHGYLDPSVLDAFEGVDLILHAGDVGDSQVLDRLRTVAPMLAVAGNLDGNNAVDLPTERSEDVYGIRIALGHKRKRLVKRIVGVDDRGFDLVVFGHDHVVSASWVEGSLWVNPGSASAPYEEDETPTVAIVERLQTGLGVRFIPIERRQPQAPHSRTASSGRKQ
jgi:putative phosphoesterase